MENALKTQLNFQAFITEKWFRIIEYSIILGGLKYFKDITSNKYIFVAYWISWFMFYFWFLELGDFLTEIFNKSSKLLNKFTINLLFTLPFVFLFYVVTKVGEAITRLP